VSQYISATKGSGILIKRARERLQGETDRPLDVGYGRANSANGIDIEPFVDTQAPNVIGDLSGGRETSSPENSQTASTSRRCRRSRDDHPGQPHLHRPDGHDPIATASPVSSPTTLYSTISGNTISGNAGQRIYSFGFDSHDNVISQNKIGTNSAVRGPARQRGQRSTSTSPRAPSRAT